MASFFKPISMIIILFLVLPLNAVQFYWGLTGGTNTASVYPDKANVITNGTPQEFFALNRIGIGGIFGLSLGKNLFFQMEPLFLQKGGRIIQEFDLDIKYSVIELPLILKITFGEKIQPQVFFGPAISVVLKSEWIFTVDGISISGNAKNVSRSFDIGFLFGAGVGIPLKRGSVCFSCRYNLGLANLIQPGNIDLDLQNYSATVEINEDEKITSEGFQVMLGFTFPFGKKQL